MKELLKLNKRNLIENYLWISGLMSFGFSLYYFFFYREINPKIFITVAVLSVLLFPLLTIGIWSYNWFRKRKYKKHILTERPYSDLEEIGFTRKVIKRNHNSLFEYVPFAEINGCELIFDIGIREPKVIEFKILGFTNHLTSSEFSKKIKEFEPYNIDIGYYGFTKTIDTKNEVFKSVHELKQILNEFTLIVKELNYEPISIVEWKNA